MLPVQSYNPGLSSGLSVSMSNDSIESESDYQDSESQSDADSDIGDATPLTAAQTPRTPRPSDLKLHHCTYEGCTKSFTRPVRLAEHQRSHTGERIYKCKEKGCDKDFLRESHLKHHIKSAHSDVREYQCNWEGCSKSFTTGTRLRRHIAAHEGREKYRCRGYEGCNETFRKHATLTRHILAVHKKEKAFPCSELDQETGETCTKAFDTVEKLKTHQRLMHDPTRFSCSICLDEINANILQDSECELNADTSHAYFPTYSLLKAHIAEIHPPTCAHCSITCSTQKELRRHIEGVHGLLANGDAGSGTPGPIIPCTYPGCDRTFKRKNNLNVHVNTVHKGQKAFICGETDLTGSKNVPVPLGGTIETCGRSFTSKSSLEEHARTAHLGLERRQVERRHKKRAAEAASQAGDVADQPIIKKRKAPTRKKRTALSTLTGVNDDSATKEASNDSPTYLADAIHQEQIYGYEVFPGYIPYNIQPTTSNEDITPGTHDFTPSEDPNDDTNLGLTIDPLLLLT